MFRFIFLTSLISLPVLAQSAAEPSIVQKLTAMMPMFIMIFAIFYFLVVRPQTKKIKEQEALLSGLKAGDQVLTESGMVAKVSAQEGAYFKLEIAPNVKVKFEASKIIKKVE